MKRWLETKDFYAMSEISEGEQCKNLIITPALVIQTSGPAAYRPSLLPFRGSLPPHS